METAAAALIVGKSGILLIRTTKRQSLLLRHRLSKRASIMAILSLSGSMRSVIRLKRVRRGIRTFAVLRKGR
jgi:hypothetical protein